MKRNKKMRLLLTTLASLLAAGAAPAPDDPTTTNPPNIIGLERIAVAENSPDPVAAYVARDAQGDPIAWSLAGRDAGTFTFTTDKEHQTMTLFFRAIPDYEQPADVPPTDNDYQVSVVATTPSPPTLATPYPVRMQVVDVADASPMPVITAPEQTDAITQAESVGGMVRAVNEGARVGWRGAWPRRVGCSRRTGCRRWPATGRWWVAVQSVDVRIVAATNCDLQQVVRENLLGGE